MKRARHLWRGMWWVAALLLALWLGPRSLPVRAAGDCQELLVNGGFENEDGWVLGVTPLTPQYATYKWHSGDRSLALGIVQGGNVQSYSSARQTVTIPGDAGKVTLSAWVYAMADGAVTTDYMELALLSADGGTILDKPWYSRNDSRTWNQMTFDLSRWRGYTLQIYFNVYNDGLGGTAGMFLDDVSLVACPAVTSTPSPQPSTLTPTSTATAPPASPTITPIVVTATHTPWIVTATFTPTPGPPPTQTPAVATQTPVVATQTPIIVPTTTYTPWPTVGPVPEGCIDLLYNGDFEKDLACWVTKPLELQVQGVTTPVHGGSWALRLGTQDRNVESYSSVRQYVTIPAGYASVTLEFWAYTWSEDSAGADRQELALLAADESVIAKPWRRLDNDRTWMGHGIPLQAYSGGAIWIYFNVYNDGAGGRTAMFLDDVRLLACGAAATSAIPSCAPGATCCMPATSPGGPTAGPMTVTPVALATAPAASATAPAASATAPAASATAPAASATAPAASATAPAAAALAPLNTFTPEVTRVALALTPRPTPTVRLGIGLQVTPTPTPAPSLLARFWRQFTSRLPQGWQRALLVAVVVLAGLVLIWRATRGPGSVV